MSVDVSIIVANWQGADIMGESLGSILHHTRGVSCELIIVDNGSTDGSVEIVRQLVTTDHRVRALFNTENLYFARACNQGYDISDGRYVLIANNDIVLRDDAVTALVRHAEAHPDVAAVTPRFIDREGRPQEFVRRLPNALYIIAHYHRLGRAADRLFLRRRLQRSFFYRDRHFDSVEVIEQAGASFSLFPRTAIDRVGGLFDERFPLLFNDVDLYRRLRDAGFVSHVVPEIRVVHLEGVSSRKLDNRAYRALQFEAMFAYFRKHAPLQVPLIGLAWPGWWVRTLWPPRHSVGRW